MDNKYLFSVVLFITNDEYNNTIKSILSQSIGFKDKIQLIVCCDPSVNADDELKKLKSKYDENVILIGKAASMKEAYEKAHKLTEGKYLNFAECGAVYDNELFSEIKHSFKEFGKYVNVVMGKCYFEGANESVQYLMSCMPVNNNIVELKEKIRIPLVFFNYCFIKAKAILNFDYPSKIDEQFMCCVLIDLFEKRPVFALTPEPMITASRSKKFYIGLFSEYRADASVFREFRDGFLQVMIDKYSKSVIPSYVQFNILMFTEWCAVEPFAKEVIVKEYDENEFKALLRKLLRKIDDNIITSKKTLQLPHKVFLLEIKYGREPYFIKSPGDKRLYFDNTRVSILSNNTTKIEFVELEKNRAKFHLRTKFIKCDNKNFSMYALVNGSEKVECVNIDRPYDSLCWGEPVYKGMTFELELDLTKYGKLCAFELYCIHNGDTVKRNNIIFEKFSPLSSFVPNCYYYKNGRILSYDNDAHIIVIEKANGFNAFARELTYLATLAKTKDDYAKHAFLARIVYPFLKLTHRKKIWLISDRTNKGDDNGEAFIKYMNTVKDRRIKCYFVIDKNSDEGKRIAKFANVISPNSKKHKFYHLIAEYVISSQANVPVVNPFQTGNKYYRDILSNMKFVFLQHGVTKDDQSAWLTKYNRNMFGFVVTTNQEYDSVFEYDYFYPPENVWLTGMPRLDLLYHDEKKYITFLPTWRKYLMHPHPDSVTGQWLLREDMKNNEYSVFYNELLNNERLLKAAKEYGYTLCFKPHPNVQPYLDKLFNFGEDIHIMGDDVTYKEVFATTDLMLTDYSSVVFDFAYLRKPIIYTHFDVATMQAGGHTYSEGYFDYERDGFGEVTYNAEDTVDVIIEYMKNGCKPKEKYLERINNTFAYNDTNCSRRIYEHLVKKPKALPKNTDSD